RVCPRNRARIRRHRWAPTRPRREVCEVHRMADEGASQGPPSPQRVEQARREGMFPFSRLLVTGGLWLALGMACIEYGPAWATGLADGFHDLLRPAQPAYPPEP